MSELGIGYEMYCDFCEDENGDPTEMVIRNGEWFCPNCGVTKSLDDPPFVCTTCGGPWPDCMDSCKLFDN